MIVLARSPVYSHVSTTLNGLSSIRAFGTQNEFEEQFYRYQDDHSATWFIFLCAARALGLLMDWLFICYIVIITVVIMTFNESKTYHIIKFKLFSNNSNGNYDSLKISKAVALVSSFLQVISYLFN